MKPQPRYLAAQLAVVILASAFLASVCGLGVGSGVYFLIYDPERVALFNGFGELIIGVIVGASCAAITYVFLSATALRRFFSKDIVTLPLKLRVSSAPFLYIGIEVLVGWTGLPTNDAFLAAQQLIILGTWIVLVLPVVSVRFSRTAHLLAIVTVVALSVVSMHQVSDENDGSDAESFRQWNGPLVLVNGTTTSFPEVGWKTLRIEAPYDNDPRRSVNLHWRRVEPPDTQKDVVVEMHSTPASYGCYNSCVVIGQTTHGPLYKSDASGDYIVAVPKGHLELAADDYSGDPVALIESLTPVDADVFFRALKNDRRKTN